MNPVSALRCRTGTTQAELARRAGTSQPTVAAYEAGKKSPTLRTLARLAGAVGLEAVVDFVPPLTREDRRSLALHAAIAKRLCEDPDGVRRRARTNVERMTRVHPHARAVLDEWREILDGSPEDILQVLADPRPHARELRHVTAFAGVLTAAERARVYSEFRREKAW
ncbi:MAG: helix-turn-helix transcriptional regulator [Actinobacteria bacterium]|nr:helix-turn-helix transcriptional regulator [Actinomycetota bacterium]